MKERPILFTGEMVRAILDGRKTQTRGLVRKQKYPHGTWATPDEVAAEFIGGTCVFSPPIGTIGDRLWVRETWRVDGVSRDIALKSEGSYRDECVYRADLVGDRMIDDAPWTPSITMPRWASRIDLEITAVRVERVQDITEEDAKKEGIAESEIGRLASRTLANYKGIKRAPVVIQFADLWQSIYANWDANPFVWVYSIKLIKP